MKTLINAFRLVLACVLVSLAAGCASTGNGTQDLAIAAGFKIIKPVNAEQETLLKSLPPHQVSQITHDGKIYFVLPDVANNQALVGGPNEYQTYQQMRLAKQISNNNLAAAQMNQMSSMNWGMWGGRGAWGPGFGW